MSAQARLFRLVDAFVPPSVDEPERQRVLRTAVLLGWLGIAFTLPFGALYAVLGSPWAGASIFVVSASLVWGLWDIRRGTPLARPVNVSIFFTWVMTAIVAWRSGGITSPALVWNFILPLSTYAACGARWSTLWTVLGALQVAGFALADRAGHVYPQDFSAATLAWLRLSGYAGFAGAMLTLTAVIEGARRASAASLADANRARERERILRDMHDGLGNQLVGLLLDTRAGRIEPTHLVRELESCFDDLRLIVDSLDPSEASLEVALAELRTRLQARCRSAGVNLRWDVVIRPAFRLDAESVLQVLRILQELAGNAIRHAGGASLDVTVRADDDFELVVRDHGVGFDAQHPPRTGRGLASLRAREKRLRAELRFEPAHPGTRAVLRVPPSGATPPHP